MDNILLKKIFKEHDNILSSLNSGSDFDALEINNLMKLVYNASSLEDTFSVYFNNLPELTSKKLLKGTSFRWKGEWLNGINYFNDEYYIDIVLYDLNLYVCNKSNIDLIPSENDSWNTFLLSSKVYIGDNNNWFVSGIDTGVSAIGEKFKFEDFTQEEILLLQKPAIDMANEAKIILSEQKVLVDESILKSEEASKNVLSSIDNANDTANHPTYIGVDNYVYQWDKANKIYVKTTIYVRGDTPYIGNNNNWFISGIDTGVLSEGKTPYIKDGYWYVNDINTNIFAKGDKGDKGDPFLIKKIYLSYNDMISDHYNPLIPIGSLVSISSNIEDPDNAKVYTKTELSYTFMFDLSGAKGFEGKTPIIELGTVSVGETSITIIRNGEDLQGNPKYLINFIIKEGEDFKFEDFTSDQIKILQQPAIEAALLANEATSNANDAISNSIIATSNANIAMSNTFEAISNANKAISNINELEIVVNNNETIRVNSEKTRVINENTRISSFDIIKLESEIVINSATNAATLANTNANKADVAAIAAKEIAEHPTYPGEDNYMYIWNSVSKEYEKQNIYIKGDDNIYLGSNPPKDGSVKIAIDLEAEIEELSSKLVSYAKKDTTTLITQEQFNIEIEDALTSVKNNKQDKPIAGRTFLTPLFVSCGAVFNDVTGFYEYNELTNITEQQAINIYIPSLALYGGNWSSAFMGSTARTAFFKDHLDAPVIPTECFRGAHIEVINFTKFVSNYSIKFTTGYLMFHEAFFLKTILGFINCMSIKDTSFMFTSCVKLEKAKLYKLSVGISFKSSPNLERESILYLIINSANTTPITVTLHATAKSRLTEEDIALAVSKNITIAI